MSGATSRESQYPPLGAAANSAPAPENTPEHTPEHTPLSGWHAGTACDRLLMLAARLTRTIAVARALIATGRVVDLTGLEDGVGLLCAKTLDLDRPDARQILPALLELMAQIEGLSGRMQQPRHNPRLAPYSAARGGH